MTLRLTEEEYQAMLRRRQSKPPASRRRTGRRWEEDFAAQCDRLVIRYEREYRFLPDRKFRFDFAMLPLCLKLAVEIDGGVHRIEGRFRSDREKGNLALAAGWRVLHVGSDQVASGAALELLRAALLQKFQSAATAFSASP